jgi:hypothetical protein
MIRRFAHGVAGPLALIVAVSVAACSKGTATSPTAPSGSSQPIANSVAAGARISGRVVAGSAAVATSGLRSLDAGTRVTVGVAGTSINTISDDGGNFTLQGVPPGPVTLTVAGSGVSGQLTLPSVGANDELEVTIRVSGGGVTLDDEQREGADGLEVEGIISAAAGGIITVGRLNTQVLVPPGTPITKGNVAGQISDLVPGVRVHVKATRSGTTLTAVTVIIQSGNNGENGSNPSNKTDTNESNSASEVKFSGVLGLAPTGTCPQVTFTVNGKTVKSNSSTRFDGGCTNIVKGATVSGEGATQTDGSILATEIEVGQGSTPKNGSSDDEDDDAGEASFSGTLAADPTGSCPAISFTVGATKVSTTAKTDFEDGGCSTVKKGASVKGEGTRQADGSILATELKVSSSTSDGSNRKDD